MAQDDFRSRRVKLRPEDFALSSGKDLPPSDLVSEETWKSMISLTDDVSLRTSDHYGSWLQLLWELWGDWNFLVAALQRGNAASPDSPIAHVALDATDYFQASIHNAMVGYYRLAFASLRSVTENMVVGLHLELSGDCATFSKWLSGCEWRLGKAADKVVKHARVKRLEDALKAAIVDDLFHQQRPRDGDEGGLVRRFFRTLSQYAHAAPNYSDADVWKSNGPIFVGEAFECWTHAFLVAYAVGVLEAQLARPDIDTLAQGASSGVRELFVNAVEQLPVTSDARRLFEAVPASVW